MALVFFGAAVLSAYSTNQLVVASPISSTELVTNTASATPGIWAYPDATACDHDYAGSGHQDLAANEAFEGLAPIPSLDIELSPRGNIGRDNHGAPHWVNGSQYCHWYTSWMTAEVRVRMAPHPEITEEYVDDLCQGLWDNLHHRSCTANKYLGYQDCSWDKELGRLSWTITTSHFCKFDQVEAAFYEATYKGRYGPLTCEPWKQVGVNTWDDETQAFAIDVGEEITIDPTTSVIPVPTSEPTTLLTATPLPAATVVPVADKLAAGSEIEAMVATLNNTAQSTKRDVGMNDIATLNVYNDTITITRYNLTSQPFKPANLFNHYNSPHQDLLSNGTGAIEKARMGPVANNVLSSIPQIAIGAATDWLVQKTKELFDSWSNQRTQSQDPVNYTANNILPSTKSNVSINDKLGTTMFGNITLEPLITANLSNHSDLPRRDLPSDNTSALFQGLADAIDAINDDGPASNLFNNSDFPHENEGTGPIDSAIQNALDDANIDKFVDAIDSMIEDAKASNLFNHYDFPHENNRMGSVDGAVEEALDPTNLDDFADAIIDEIKASNLSIWDLFNNNGTMENNRMGSVGSAVQGSIESAIFEGLVDGVDSLIDNAEESN